MKKIQFFLIIALMFFSSCEDKGVTEKFIGTWKVESYSRDGEQLIPSQFFRVCTINIKDVPYETNFGYGEGYRKDAIYYKTEEHWLNFRDNDMKWEGQIRFEKGSKIIFRFLENIEIYGIYEVEGSRLIIKGTTEGGKLVNMTLSRYS